MGENPADRSEEEFLASYDPGEYPPIGVTVDIVVLSGEPPQVSVLLVERGDHPYRGCWAIPGGFVEHDEDLADAAARELAEETGIDVDPSDLVQFRAYGAPGRDPRLRTVSIVYVVALPGSRDVRAGSDAAHARFVSVDELEAPDAMTLAFDHGQILCDALGWWKERSS